MNDVNYNKSCVTLISLEIFNFELLYVLNYLKLNKMANITEFKGNWNEQKGKLKQKFAILTENELMFDEGKKDEMLGKLQIKLGKTKEQLHDILGVL